MGFGINRGMDDPSTALITLKAAIDLCRTAKAAFFDALNHLPEGKDKEAAAQSLEEAEKATQLAEASIAQAFGYELCKCEFPPTPMLRIGYRDDLSGKEDNVLYVYECPKCKQNSARMWAFERQIGGSE